MLYGWTKKIRTCSNKNWNIATGGICGRANRINGIFVINNCINQGKIISNEATEESGFGGIIGTIESSGTVCLNNVYNKGKIENASQPWEKLSKMSKEVARAIIKRANYEVK